MARIFAVLTIVFAFALSAKAQPQLSGSWLAVRTLATIPPGATETVYSSSARVLTLTVDRQSIRGVEHTLLRIPEGAWDRVPDGYETYRDQSVRGMMDVENGGMTLVFEGEDGESTHYRVTLTEDGTRLHLVRSDDPTAGARSYRRIPSLAPRD